jgi:hypothetical protein
MAQRRILLRERRQDGLRHPLQRGVVSAGQLAAWHAVGEAVLVDGRLQE